MSFKVQVGPLQIAIHQGRTALACQPDGTIPFPREKGLHFNDMRLISGWSRAFIRRGSVASEASGPHATWLPEPGDFTRVPSRRSGPPRPEA